MRSLLLLLACFWHTDARAGEAELVAAAKREKLLTVAGPPALLKPIAAAFRKKYPFLRVEALPMQMSDSAYHFFQIFESDLARERGDALVRVLDKNMDEWAAHGWLAKLDGLPLWPSRPIGGESGAFYANFVGDVHGIAYDPRLVPEKELPKSYDELLDPKWKDAIAIRSPLKDVAAATFMLYAKETHGFGWLRRLGGNRPRVTQQASEHLDTIGKGGCRIALARDMEVAAYRARHPRSRLRFAVLGEEVPYQYVTVSVNAGAFHPSAARLYANFLLSKEAEAVFTKAGFSAGAKRASDLSHRGVWIWDTARVSDLYEYESSLARAMRELRDGGARIDLLRWYGRPSLE